MTKINTPLIKTASMARMSSIDDAWNEHQQLVEAASKVLSMEYRPDEKKKINYKYAEDRIIADFATYIDQTYGEHYHTGSEENISCFDAWGALGSASTTARDTAIKYLWRYGKKNGNNKADLMKTLHYVILCLYLDHYKDA
jgi:hypothetical protein